MELGGTEAFIMNNYRVLDRTRYQFDFLVFVEKDYAYIDEIKSLGGRVFFSGVPAPGNLKHFCQMFKKVIEGNGPYAAIHCHVNVQNGFVLYAAQKNGIPIRISHSHALYNRRHGFPQRIYDLSRELLIKRSATCFAACSELAGKSLYGKKFFEKNGIVIPNGINLNPILKCSRVQQDSLKNDFNIPTTCSLIIGNITRFDDNKNQEFIIDVFAEIKKEKPDALLILGGVDGGGLARTQHKVRALKLESSVRFIGVRKDVHVWLKIIDVFLVPSKAEGFSFALLEAQAAGCLCMASSCIPRESDILGLIEYCDLDDGPKLWAQKLMRAYLQYKAPEKDYILNKFQQSGYEIMAAHEKLVKLYDEEADAI